MGGTTSIIDNAPLLLPNQPLVYDWLTERRVQWCAYQNGDYFPFFTLMPSWMDEIANSLVLDTLIPHAHPRFRRYRNFARDWLHEQNMPSVIFIEPEYTDGPHRQPNDDHPPTGVTPGQAFLADIYGALTANSVRWSRTVLIVTYDEHGGFFDHVPPLNIPARIVGHGPTPAFATTGVRVPGFIVSPLVDPATVYTGPLDHTSLLQFLAEKFASGVYSADVAERQLILSSLSDALTRTAPRTDIPPPPAVQVRAPGPPLAFQRAPGANANATAFRVAAAKLAADHPGILAAGWPSLMLTA